MSWSIPQAMRNSSWWINTWPPYALVEKTLRCALWWPGSTLWPKPQLPQLLLAHNHTLYCFSLFPVSLPHFSTHDFFDLISNKWLSFKSLSQQLLLGESNLRHPSYPLKLVWLGASTSVILCLYCMLFNVCIVTYILAKLFAVGWYAISSTSWFKVTAALNIIN